MRRRTFLGIGAAAITLGGGAFAVANAATEPEVAAVRGGIDFGRPEVVATGLEVPWGLGFLPDGSALVTQRRSGTVTRIRPGAAPERVATIAGVAAGGEAGLLGLAISPTYATDGFIFVCFTTASDIRIVRFTLAVPTDQQVIFKGPARASTHDGGRIKFGPDGMLYATIGDAGDRATAQRLASLNGKILRMRPDGTVPADNPFPGSPVYSLGHRNPQGLAWDGRGRLYAAEFGQNTWDEVNLIVAGGNYGWPTVEGRADNPRFLEPLVVWGTAEASPSGVAFANGTLFVAALRGQRLWTVPLTDAGTAGTPVAELVNTHGRLRTVEVAPDGSLWVATSNRDGRGAPEETDDRLIRFPASGVTASATPDAPSPEPTTSG